MSTQTEVSDRQMLDFIRQQGAVTISALIAEMGVTATAVRQRIQRLTEEGLIERKTENLPDAEVVAIVQKEVKKRRDSVEQFEKGGRAELAAKEKEEIAVLEMFLPKALSPEELEKLVRAAIQELSATSKKDMGPVIKAVQTKAAGSADGKSISALVGKLLP